MGTEHDGVSREQGDVARDVEGKLILVTGASIGIGREIALRFAAAKCRLVLTHLYDRTEAEEVAQRCLGLGAQDVRTLRLDLADEDSIRDLTVQVADGYGSLGILVNNAGVIDWRPLSEQSLADIDEQIRVNLLGVIELTTCLLPLIADAVITIGSTAALHRSRTPPPYCASKWGLRGFVKALALEHPDKRIVSVHPTVTATSMNDMQGMPPARVADVVFRVATGEIDVEPGGDVDLRDYRQE